LLEWGGMETKSSALALNFCFMTLGLPTRITAEGRNPTLF